MTPEEAIRFFGSARKLAKALSIDPSAVTRWVKRKRVPPARQKQIAAISESVAARERALVVDEDALLEEELQKKKRAAVMEFVMKNASDKVCEKCRLRPARHVKWYCGGESYSSFLCGECDEEEVLEIERASWTKEKAE